VTYVVKEIFFTLQGEGANAGRPAVFVRFSGCNLWSGREADRRSAVCKFCDTEFRGGERFADAETLAKRIEGRWHCGWQTEGYPPTRGPQNRFAVLTGGEPALQVDQPLLAALRERHFFTAIETNGTVPLKAHPDWITVSPKTRELAVTDGDELKLVHPQDCVVPADFEHLNFQRFYVQPKWERWPWQRKRNLTGAIQVCHDRRQWRLSTQTHKVVGIA
jgi:7-carboxy-7-deazaguanine synthase